MHNSPERAQKILANLGYGSRRKIEKLILTKQIRVNGNLIKLGDKISFPANVEIGNEKHLIHNYDNSEPELIIYNKMLGEICTTNDPEGRPSVFNKLPSLQHKRWVMIGRLDINTSGLLLFTQSGELAEKMMHPRYGLEREYLVKVCGKLNTQHLEKLCNGVELADGIALFKSCIRIKENNNQNWYKVVLTEGRNKIVRRLFESQGVSVSKLKRIRFGNIILPKELKIGCYFKSSVDKIIHLT